MSVSRTVSEIFSVKDPDVTFKLRAGVVQGHWKDHIRLFIGPPLYT